MMPADSTLSVRQTIQVSLLYHFASLDYLKGLQLRLHALVHPDTDKPVRSARPNRGAPRGSLHNPHSVLQAFESSVAGQIAKRASQAYAITGAYQCGRSMSELGVEWLLPAEQDRFDAHFEQLSHYAGNIDDTMDKHHPGGGWNDFYLTLCYREERQTLPKFPSLRLRPDITGHSGEVPERTGVYLPLDDPLGTPQFCRTGAPAGELLECATFNDLGLDAWRAVGSQHLWIDDDRMHAFVQTRLHDPLLTKDPFFTDSAGDAHLASSLVARNAFTTRPCEWIYVEQLDVPAHLAAT